jgi:hypothetical protein
MTTRTELFRLNGAVDRDPAIDGWMKEHRHCDMVDAMTQAACWLASYQLPTLESHNAFTGEVNW